MKFESSTYWHIWKECNAGPMRNYRLKKLSWTQRWNLIVTRKKMRKMRNKALRGVVNKGKTQRKYSQ